MKGTVGVVDETARQHAVATLTLAFSSDPVVRWAWPDSKRYLAYWPPFVDAFGGRAFEEGTAHGLEDHVAIALWLPPGVESDGETVMSLVRESMDDQTYEDISGVFEQMDETHPTCDHWYLPLMALEPLSPRAAVWAPRSCNMRSRRATATVSPPISRPRAPAAATSTPAMDSATSRRSRPEARRHFGRCSVSLRHGSRPRQPGAWVPTGRPREILRGRCRRRTSK